MAMKFDRQEVIKKATNLFWERGFHATSMRTLKETIDMRPGSIYASFGSKEGLYKEALNYYADLSVKEINVCREAHDSPLSALKVIITSIVTGCVSSPGGMCMLVKSIAELTAENEDLLKESCRLMGRIEVAFVAILTEAATKGEIPSDKDPARLARFLQMQLMGIRAYVLANKETVCVEELVEDALSCLR